MKQFIFIAIALFLTTSLLPSNLVCQFILQGDPVVNLGVPYPVEHNFTRKLDNGQRIRYKKGNKQSFSNDAGGEKDTCGFERHFIQLLKEIQIIFHGDN